ncbi:AP2-like ethylene-responsive transcription factor PLT1 [Morus notabilis]|uniref:AP2-like ethylene-responsive transcription factor PLT1 n=1 Tax=Morus notabilis TaxID=981085 RepID=UPI000CED6799|nr:AP2-like ethylene-responsive transcription factor PLT1 [Morus notabilis]
MEHISSNSRSSRQLTEPIHSAFPDFGTKKDFGILEESIFRFKSSTYRGVQKIKDKETYVAHVYDNGHLPKTGRTIYLGRFDQEENAARAHDLVSLKFWGTSAQTNFPIIDYEKALEAMENLTDQDVVVAVRRSSSSFSRGKSKYRGVVRSKSEEEAAIAFDIASIKLKGFKAITNFDLNSYNVKAILQGETEQKDKETEKMVNLTAKFAASNITRRQESSGIGNRKKKRSLSFHNFIDKQTETGFSGNANTLSETPVISSAGSGSQHGALVPFLSEIASLELEFPREHNGSLAMGFQHSNSSAFQSYKQMEPRQTSILQEADTLLPEFELWSSNLYPPYMSQLFKEQELKGLGSGFQHASSSCFKPFRQTS